MRFKNIKEEAAAMREDEDRELVLEPERESSYNYFWLEGDEEDECFACVLKGM